MVDAAARSSASSAPSARSAGPARRTRAGEDGRSSGRRGAETREAIDRAAVKLFAKLGYHAASMREIAAAAGIQPAAIYHWYPSKEAILVRLQDDFMEQLTAKVLAAMDRQDRPALRLAAAVREHVVFHGRQPRAVVRGLLARVHVAVAPSVPTADGRREGIPVVLMEAAACGLPLVASRLSGIPELVESEQSGLLVEPGDVDGLAAALARLAREPETRVRLGRAARARVEAGFALAANVERLRARFAEAARSAP